MRPFLMSKSYDIEFSCLTSVAFYPSLAAASPRLPLPACGERVGVRDDAGEGLISSVYESVELGGVLAGDLVHDIGRQIGELLGDVLRAFRPDTVGMRVIRAPHQGLDPHILDELGADPVELKRRAALTAPVFARLELHQVAEAVLKLEIHAVERIGQPADAALAKADPHVRIALQDAGADDRGDDVDQVHLEAGDACELRHAADLPLLLHAHLL